MGAAAAAGALARVRDAGAFGPRCAAPASSNGPRPEGACWPARGPSGRLLALRAGGRGTTVTAAAYAAEHACDFWDLLPAG